MAERGPSLVEREAILPVALLGVLAVGIWHYYAFRFSLPLWLGAVFVAYLYRDPKREVPSAPLAVVSPADGTVQAVESVRDGYLDRDAIRVTLPVRSTGSFVTRSPSEGKIVKQWRGVESVVTGASRGGRPADALWLQTDEGDDLLLEVTAGWLNLRLRCYVHSGERVGQGQRCGLTRPGSTVSVYLPANARVHVSPGDRVRAGADAIASFVHL